MARQKGEGLKVTDDHTYFVGGPYGGIKIPLRTHVTKPDPENKRKKIIVASYSEPLPERVPAEKGKMIRYAVKKGRKEPVTFVLWGGHYEVRDDGKLWWVNDKMIATAKAKWNAEAETWIKHLED